MQQKKQCLASVMIITSCCTCRVAPNLPQCSAFSCSPSSSFCTVYRSHNATLDFGRFEILQPFMMVCMSMTVSMHIYINP